MQERDKNINNILLGHMIVLCKCPSRQLLPEGIDHLGHSQVRLSLPPPCSMPPLSIARRPRFEQASSEADGQDMLIFCSTHCGRSIHLSIMVTKVPHSEKHWVRSAPTHLPALAINIDIRLLFLLSAFFLNICCEEIVLSLLRF